MRTKRSGPLLAVLLVLSLLCAGCLNTDSNPFFGDDDDEGIDYSVKVIGDRQVSSTPENTNEISVVVNPTNPLNVVMGANDYSTPHNDVWCGVYTSFDGGETWASDMIPGHPTDFSVEGLQSPLKPFMGSGDPVLAAASDGSMYYAGIAFERTVAGPSAIFVAKSTDGGRNWPSRDIRIISYYGDGVSSFHDKEWITVDPNNGNIYCVWAMFSLYSASNIMFSRSTDGGNTWSPETIISEYTQGSFGNQGTGISVDNSGKIHIIWIDFDDNEMLYVTSDDYGSSFTNPSPIANVSPVPYPPEGGSYRTPTLPALGVDISGTKSDGNLYACWNDNANGDADAVMIYSHDNGESWSELLVVNDDKPGEGGRQFFPTLQVDEHGLVHMIFYDTRDDPQKELLAIYYAISGDYGKSWENHRLSSESFDGNAGGGSWRGEITSGDAFIGDYLDIDVGDGYAYGGWCDTRNGEPNARNSDCYGGIVKYR